jgi:hypothetical protein
MKKMFALLLLTIGVNAQFNSTKSWMERSNLNIVGNTPIPNRAYAVSFVVDNQAYIATGESGSSTLSDCWRFTTGEAFGFWEQRGNIPGGGRSFAFAFTIANIGYVGGGNGAAGGYSPARQDFYRYNSGTNTWTARANLPVANRGASATFATTVGGYVIGGSPTPGFSNTSNNTCMRYEPGTNTWNTSIANIPTTSNRLMFAFGYTVGANGFVTCGFEHGMAYNPLWRYNDFPANAWTEISFATPTARFPGALRRAPSGFVLGNTPYIGLGFASGVAQNTFYFFDGTSWIQTPNYLYNNGIGALGFSINPSGVRQRGFIATGASANPPSLVATNTNTEYQPLYITTGRFSVPGVSFCANTIIGIPIYADRAFNHTTTTGFIIQLVTYDGTNFTVVGNNIGNVTGVDATNRTNTVQVAFPNVATSFNGYYIRLTSSEGPVTLTGAYGPFTINPAPNPPSAIVGSSTICQNSTRLYTVRNDFVNTTPGFQWARKLVWTTNNTNASFLGQNFSNTGFNAPNTVLGLRVASVFGLTPGTTNLSVYELNTATGCMSTTVTSPITVVSAPTRPTITGTNTLCLGGTSTYSVISQAGVNYTWFKAGVISVNGLGNTANVIGTASGVGTLTVRGQNFNCTVNSAAFNITVNGIPTITGNNFPCNLTPTVYSIPTLPGATFTWSITGSGATIQSSGNVATVTGNTSATKAILTITAFASTCGQSSKFVITINGCCRPYYSNTVGVNSILGAGVGIPNLDAGGGVITLSGSYNVVGRLTLKNGTFVVPEGTKIWHEGGERIEVDLDATLSVTGGIFNRACGTAWDGILLYGNLYTTSSPGTGAMSGIFGSWSGVFPESSSNMFITHTVFNDVYKAINMYHSPVSGIIKNNIFGGDGVLVPTFSGFSLAGNGNATFDRNESHIYVYNKTINHISITGNTFKNARYMTYLYGDAAVLMDKNYFQVEYIGLNVGYPTQTYSGTTYFTNNDVFLNTQLIGVSLGISCFNNIKMSGNYIHDEDGNPSNNAGQTSGIEMSCEANTDYNVEIYNNTISGMHYACEAGFCNSYINIHDNYMVNNTYCIFGGGTYQNKYRIRCNTFKNAEYGLYSATTGTVPGFINQTITGNKFINVSSPIYQASSPTGAWTYDRVTDDGISGVYGTGSSYVTINVGGTVFGTCGTNTPGLRMGADINTTDISVYPNPFEQELNIDFQVGDEVSYEVEIYNTLGTKLSTETGITSIGSNKLAIRMEVSKGLYILQLKIGGKPHRIKVLKN